MKRTLIEERKRILKIMSQLDKSILLTEINEKYLNKLLDKINNNGVDSLTPEERNDLEKMSQGEDVREPEPEKLSLGLTDTTLRFTAARDATIIPKDRKKLFGTTKYGLKFIHGEAEELAGNDIPIFLDGDMSQLDKDPEEQDIRMIIPKGEYECVAITMEEPSIEEMCYYLVLKPDEDL